MQYPDFTSKGPPPCSMTDPDAFFPEAENEGSISRANEAKKVCLSGCPYIKECFAWAMSNREQGVWGGTSTKERITLRREALRPIRY